MALTACFSEVRIMPQIRVGKVLLAPILKKVMMKSSNERAAATKVAPTTVERIIGWITVVSTLNGVAPRSPVLCTAVQSKVASRIWMNAVATSAVIAADIGGVHGYVVGGQVIVRLKPIIIVLPANRHYFYRRGRLDREATRSPPCSRTASAVIISGIGTSTQ